MSAGCGIIEMFVVEMVRQLMLCTDIVYLAVVITQGSTVIRASNKALTSVQLCLDLS